MALNISSPNLYSSTPGQVALNQWGATSGRKQPRYYLDSIIQGELDAAERRRSARALEEERKRQFDIGQQNAMDTAASSRTAGMLGGVTQLGGTYLLANALKPAPQIVNGVTNAGSATPIADIVSKAIPPYSQSSQVSLTSTPTGGPTVNAPSIAGDTVLQTSTPGATGPAGQGLSQSFTNTSPTLAEGAGMGTDIELADIAGTAGPLSSSGGVVSKALPVVGYIGGALAAKNMWGGKDTPWDDKTTWQKATTAPGTSGGALPLLVGEKIFGQDSAPGKAYKEVSRIEQQAMKPIEAVFDWIGGLF